MFDLNQPHFQDADKAREYLEGQVWPKGPVCPHCGGFERNHKLNGKTQRKGLYFCGDCREQFTVTVGSVFERSKIPLHKWLLAVHLLCSSKKGMSSHQLHRMLGVTYKTAWFMTHRIREAFKMPVTPIGGGGKIIEADETFYGKIKRRKPMPGGDSSHKILSLVTRGGDTRSFHIAAVTGKILKPILQQQIARDTHLMTDAATHYKTLRGGFLSHETVKHTQGQYAKKSRAIKGETTHTNTVESFFGLLKRGLVGTYHHVSEAHLQRYCTEFDFRFTHRKTSDDERTRAALKQIRGKRLTYRRTREQDQIQDAREG